MFLKLQTWSTTLRIAEILCSISILGFMGILKETLCQKTGFLKIFTFLTASIPPVVHISIGFLKLPTWSTTLRVTENLRCISSIGFIGIWKQTLCQKNRFSQNFHVFNRFDSFWSSYLQLSWSYSHDRPLYWKLRIPATFIVRVYRI